jgi:hypothetical protein
LAGFRATDPRFRQTEIFGVSAELVAGQAENRLARDERGDVPADRFDLAGELASQDRPPRPSEPREETNEYGIGLAKAAVRAIDGRGVDLDEQVIGSGDRRGNGRNPNDLGRPIPRMDSRPHEPEGLTFSTRAGHCGSHQFQRPRIDITAGTSIARTIVASSRMPAASAGATILISVPGLAPA